MPKQGTNPRILAGADGMKIAMLVGVGVLLAISYAQRRQIGQMEERLGASLSQVEIRLEPAGAAPSKTVPSTPLSEPTADPLVAARNPTVSALVGVTAVPSKQPDANRVYNFQLADAPAKGPHDAPVTLVEFSDFQCSFCRRSLPTVARIEEVYGDLVRRVWKHLPLAMHAQAPMAHLASVAAARQGKFWEYHDALLSDQGKLNPDGLRQVAFELGLEMQRFEEDLADPGVQQLVEADMAEAVSVDLTATPGFFVNGRYLGGARPFEDFAARINEELDRLGLPVPEAALVQSEPPQSDP